MLGRLLDRMPEESLQRMVDTPPDKWLYGMYHHEMFPNAGTCLIGHAARVEAEDHEDGFWEGEEWINRRWDRIRLYKQELGIEPEDFTYERRYDALRKRFAKPPHTHRIVRALQLRALRILLRRAGRPASILLPQRALSTPSGVPGRASRPGVRKP
jgi:hypothetical protein